MIKELLEKQNVKVTRIKKLYDDEVVEEYIHIEVGDGYGKNSVLTIAEAEEVFKQLKEKLNK